jgi:tRNA pseudouridine55 synthase
MPDRQAIDRELEAFRGTFLQQPPAFSAKKIDGTRSYQIARKASRVSTSRFLPSPAAPTSPPVPVRVSVTAHAIDIVACDGPTVTVRVHCTAGFYVRALACDLGERLGVGAHLSALRRTSAGDLTLEQAVPLGELADVDGGKKRAIEAIVPLARMLTAIPACSLTPDGVRRAVHGRDLGPADFAEGFAGADGLGGRGAPHSGHFRLIDPDGALVGVAEASAMSGLLHPSVVLM